MKELKEAILHFNSLGIPVKRPGLDRVAPSISVDGEVRIKLRLDCELRTSINQREAYSGRVENRGNIGLTRDEFKAMWDAERPDDPLEL